MNVLVDTSVWSLALRRKSDDLSRAEKSIVAELAELIREGRARLIGPIRQGLLSGIKTEAQYDTLRTALQSFPDEVIATSHYEAAAAASNKCRAKGLTVSAIDILICAVASSRHWPILTTDPDFKRYAKVLPVRLYEPRK